MATKDTQSRDKVLFNTKALQIEAVGGFAGRPDAELLLDSGDPHAAGAAPEFVLQDVEGGDQQVVVDRVVARWRDPFTLPRTRAECVQWARGDWPWGGGWKVCTGHKYQSSWMDVTARLRVTVLTPQGVKAAVDDCLRQGAVAGALSGILSAVTGNPAAVETAIAAFVQTVRSCLEQKLRDVVDVSLTTSSEWSEYA